jgi:hypothetical protein
VKQTLLSFRQSQIIHEAAWNRIAEYTIDLKRVRGEGARMILEARLERFHEPFLELDEMRRHLDGTPSSRWVEPGWRRDSATASSSAHATS